MPDGAAAVRFPLRTRSVAKGPLRLLVAPAGPIAAWLERLVAAQVVDRGVALGALAFSALFPLMIVYGALVPLSDSRDFSAALVHRLHLTDGAAQTVRAAVAPPNAVAGSITAIGVVLVLFSGLSLARAVQRLYEVSYKLPAAGVRGTPWHLLWILLLPIYITLRPLVVGIGGPLWHLLGSLVLGALVWLSTPYVLLGRRLSWRALMPSAVLASVSMTVFGFFSAIYLPHSVSSSASKFGAIGIAFALLSWLVLAGFVLVGAATGGAVAREWLEARRS
ncbi:MAG TPA: YhjD/YihY/BrkB family envelope integrity protein [Solirubrobacteraceae bacterium]